MLAIVLELQIRGNIRAEDLARTFEVSKRTIYRDITALSEAKVPIIASPGTGYRLMDGYFLPPLSFTPDEAAILMLGAQAVRFTVDSVYREAVQGAMRKLEAVLPTESRTRVQELSESMRIFGGWASPRDAEKLSLLRTAILERRVVHMHYHSPRQDGPLDRSVEPYSLAFYRNVWHLTGFCRLRQDMREFRLDRIDELELLPDGFIRDDGRTERPRRERGEPLVVRVRFASRVVRWVREERHWSHRGDEPDGVMIFHVSEPADIAPWLLRWGPEARVLEPDSVRDAIVEAARQITNIYSPSLTH